MKKLILAVFTFFCASATFAQKGNNQFAIFGGYENFPNLIKESGYNVGIEFKHYVHNRIFIIANFHAGINDGSKLLKYSKAGEIYSHNLKNSARDYMIGFGIGGDLLQEGRHKVYVQGTVGLGSSEERKYHFTDIDLQDLQTHEKKLTGYAISATIGYDYQISRWLAAGIHYTGYQLGQKYKNSCNAKICILF